MNAEQPSGRISPDGDILVDGQPANAYERDGVTYAVYRRSDDRKPRLVREQDGVLTTVATFRSIELAEQFRRWFVRLSLNDEELQAAPALAATVAERSES